MKETQKRETGSSKPPFFHKFEVLNHFFLFFPISGTLVEVDKDDFSNLSEDNYPEDAFFKEEREIWEKGPPKFKPPTFLKSMCLLVSQTCNMKCSYCFVDGGTYGGKERLMSEKIAKDAILYLLNNAKTRNVEVDFFGGEPLLNWKVVKETVVFGNREAEKRNKRIRFSLTTNGVLLNEEKMDFFDEYKVSLILSLDGPKSINDMYRKMKDGRGSFDFVWDKIKMVRDRRNEGYYIRGTFTRKNLNIGEISRFFWENKFPYLSLEPAILPEENEMAIRKEDLSKIIDEYEKMAKEIYERRKIGEDYHFYHFNIDLEGGPCIGKMSFGCGAGVEYIAIDTNGDIYPCHWFSEFPQMKMGNIYTGIDEEKKKIFVQANILDNKKCKTCWAKYLCGGGCIAHSYLRYKDLFKPPEEFCTLQKRRIEIGLFLNSISSQGGLL